MAEGSYGLIPQEEWLDVGFQVDRPNDPLDGLVGDLRTNNIIAKWQSIAAEYQTSIMTQFHAFDTESRKTIRVPVDTYNVKKGAHQGQDRPERAAAGVRRQRCAGGAGPVDRCSGGMIQPPLFRARKDPSRSLEANKKGGPLRRGASVTVTK